MTKNPKKPASEFEKAVAALPACGWAMFDPLGHKTISDLAFTVECEIDLILSGEDGTDPADLKPLRKWLKKWAPKAT